MDRESSLTGFRCVRCGHGYPAKPFRMTCEACGGNLDVLYDYSEIAGRWSREALAADGDRSLWRYLPLLPVESAPRRRSIQVGGTPLVELAGLAAEFGIDRLWVKDDTRNPSASLKDRASEVGIRHAVEAGNETIVVASTGNAAASLACLAAWHKVKAVILAPASAPPAKLTQILQYGATLCPVAGSYDDAFDLTLQVAEKRGWYLRSTGVNPVMSEGKKTVALEIAEQLEWEVPDRVFVPVGDGCIIGGIYKGFHDLLSLGWIERIPKIMAVQAEGSAAIANVIHSDSELQPVKANTVADSISVDFPRDGLKAVRAVRETGGGAITISDDEILSAQRRLASASGIFAEPAAAAAFAGLIKAHQQGSLGASERVVVTITGSGLKDVSAARKQIEIPKPVEPTLEGFEKFMRSAGVEG
ncbi:MAG: threonine synthase [bacterium]